MLLSVLYSHYSYTKYIVGLLKKDSDYSQADTHCDIMEEHSGGTGAGDEEEKTESLVEMGPVEEQKTAEEDPPVNLPVVVHQGGVLQETTRSTESTLCPHNLGYTPSALPSYSTLGILQTQVIHGAQELYKQQQLPPKTRILPWYSLQTTLAALGARRIPQVSSFCVYMV